MTSLVQVHKPGDTVTLVCRTDSYWEYCSWSHKQRKCNLEWKYSKGDVVKQDCHGDLDPRLHYSGNYEKHECSITISSLELEDAGLWRCEMESYVLGSSRGYKSRNKIEVVIEAKTTTGTTKQTTTESLPTTKMSTTTEVTTATSTTTTTEDAEVLSNLDDSDTEEEEERELQALLEESKQQHKLHEYERQRQSMQEEVLFEKALRESVQLQVGDEAKAPSQVAASEDKHMGLRRDVNMRLAPLAPLRLKGSAGEDAASISTQSCSVPNSTSESWSSGRQEEASASRQKLRGSGGTSTLRTAGTAALSLS